MTWRAVVKSLHNTSGRQRGDVNASVGVIEELLWIRCERAQWFHGGIVPGIHLCGRKTARQRAPARGHASRPIERLTGISAVAEHVQPAIPGRGQADLESDLRLNLSGDPAELRCVGGRRN